MDSVFVARLLCAWVPGDADVWLEDALDFVDNEINFRYFRINEILNYRSGSKSDPGLLDQIVATFYNEELLQADFSNCRWDNYNEQTLTGEGYNHREELLGRLYMQYRFPTDKKRLMEMVWLDGEGTYSLDPYTVSTRPTLSHMILEELNEDEKAVFGMSLIANIRSGIKCRRVLATHLQLCKYLGVQQAREIVLEMLLGGSYEAIGLLELTDIYINLDGDPSELKGIFHSLSHDSLEFIKYVSLLIGTIPEEVGPALLSCIADNGVDKDIRGTAARHLCNIGEMAGFDYLIEYMRLNRRTSPSMQDSLKISPVDTAVALERMNDLIHVLVEPEQAFTRFYESVAYTLQEWLYKFAEKSERDLDIVVQYLLAWQQKFQDTHPLHYNLYWYAFRAIENFRKIQPQSKNIREIKILLSQYS